ncbi:hypothetical protein ACFL04_00125 [Patescibacteria group bacterium]
MKKIMVVICLTVVLAIVAAPVAISPTAPKVTEAQAFVMPAECAQAASFGWHAHWANRACFQALKYGFS